MKCKNRPKVFHISISVPRILFRGARGTGALVGVQEDIVALANVPRVIVVLVP